MHFGLTSPEELDGFKLNYKPEGLDVFKLLDTVPLEVQEEQFNFTGGWDYLSVFSRTKKGDDERSLQLTQYFWWCIANSYRYFFRQCKLEQRF